MTPLRADDVHRTALLALHDGSQPSLKAALAAHADTGVVLCADQSTCSEITGQAALMTAVVAAVRAFGNVVVLIDKPDALISGGVLKELTLAEAIARQGARLVAVHTNANINEGWPILLIGADTPVPSVIVRGNVSTRPVLRVSWSGWVANVSATEAPALEVNGSHCVLAAIAAAAMGISEAFGQIRAQPGSDAGFRNVVLDLWNPGSDPGDLRPPLAHAPAAWWLVGLGHLGQAYCWVIAWLKYQDPSVVEVVLQDVECTTPANHSTGVLTPKGSDGVHKTRLAADALERAGFKTRILERRLGPDMHVTTSEAHVALIGIDNLSGRLLISGVEWRFAVDIGLGSGPVNYASLLMRRFPGAERSDQVIGWTKAPPTVIAIPNRPAFAELLQIYGECGVVELAGKAVGASFVGIVAACLGVAEASRELHDGKGFDVLTLDLATMYSAGSTASASADIISSPLAHTWTGTL